MVTFFGDENDLILGQRTRVKILAQGAHPSVWFGPPDRILPHIQLCGGVSLATRSM